MEIYLKTLKTLDECIESKYLESLSLNEAADNDKKESISKFIYAGIKKLWQLLLAAFRKFGNYLKALFAPGKPNLVAVKDIVILKCVYKFSPMVVANMKLLDKGNINQSTVENIKSFMDKEKTNNITLKKGTVIDVKSIYSTCESYVNALSSSNATNANSSDTYAKQAYDEYSAFVNKIISDSNDLQKGIAQNEYDNLIDRYVKNGEILRSDIALDIKYRKLTHDDIEKICNDQRIKSGFIGSDFSDKHPKEEWTKDYLAKLSWVAVAESFNKDYLLYLEQVADYVSKRKVNNRVI